MERVKGIEPSYSAWEAAALPLSYTRDALGVSDAGQDVKMPPDPQGQGAVRVTCDTAPSVIAKGCSTAGASPK